MPGSFTSATVGVAGTSYPRCRYTGSRTTAPRSGEEVVASRIIRRPSSGDRRRGTATATTRRPRPTHIGRRRPAAAIAAGRTRRPPGGRRAAAASGSTSPDLWLPRGSCRSTTGKLCGSPARCLSNPPSARESRGSRPLPRTATARPVWHPFIHTVHPSPWPDGPTTPLKR